MMKSLTTQIADSRNLASAVAGKKTGKSSTHAALLEMLSQLSQQGTTIAKPAATPFKKLLDPKKITHNTVAEAHFAKDKNADIAVSVLPAAIPAIKERKTDIKSSAHLPTDRPYKPHIGKVSDSTMLATTEPRLPTQPLSVDHKDLTDIPTKEKVSPKQIYSATAGPKHVEIRHGAKVTSDNQPAENSENTAESANSAKASAIKAEPAPVQIENLPNHKSTDIPAADTSDPGFEQIVQKDTPTHLEKEHPVSKPTPKAAPALQDHSKDHGQAPSTQNKPAQPDIIHNKDVPSSVRQDASTPAMAKNHENGLNIASQNFTAAMMNGPEKAVTVTQSHLLADNSQTARTDLNLSDQLTVVVKNASDKIGQNISVHLNPPELGKITIKFEKIGDEVVGHLQVEKADTKNNIELNLSQIVQNINDAGVQLKRLDITLHDQSFANQQQFDGHPQPDGSQRHAFEQTLDSRDMQTAGSGDTQHPNSYGLDSSLTDKAVNILI